VAGEIILSIFLILKYLVSLKRKYVNYVGFWVHTLDYKASYPKRQFPPRVKRNGKIVTTEHYFQFFISIVSTNCFVQLKMIIYGFL
jgi:hypothetical protein